MLEVKKLKKKFGSNVVLNDISFNVSKGDIISIVGPSGSGKSTLLRCINYLEKPTAPFFFLCFSLFRYNHGFPCCLQRASLFLSWAWESHLQSVRKRIRTH